MALRRQWKDSADHDAEDFVFCKKDGTTLSGDVLRREVLCPTLDRLGWSVGRGRRDSTPSATRAASFINAKTRNLKLAQKPLGHSKLTMTAEDGLNFRP